MSVPDPTTPPPTAFDVFAQVPVAISATDLQGRFTAVNAAFEALFGVTAQQVIGEHATVMLSPAEWPWHGELRRRLLSGELDVFRSTRHYVLAGGVDARLNIVAVVSTDDLGAPTGVITSYDVAQSSVSAMGDSFLQRVLDVSNTMLFTLDRSGIVQSATGRQGPAFGYPADYWERRPIGEIVVDDDVQRFERFFADLVERPGHRIDIECAIRAADGAERSVLASGISMLSDPGVAAVVLSLQDVSALREQISSLAEQRRIAEGVAKDRANLVATVSHELRNPLHALLGLSELLATAELGDELGEIAVELHAQLAGLAGVTSDLLDSARTERGFVKLHPEPTDVNALLNTAVAFGRAAVTTKPVTVTGALEPGTPEAVNVDRARVEQILRNLVGNAVKFTESGSVTITVGPVAHGLHLTVSDQGSGICPADLERIHEPFERGVDAANVVGAGLGLAIVNDLARAMDGTVTVDSTVGKGSTFRVELRAPTSVSEPASSKGSQRYEPLDLDVLVVDDDRTNRLMASRQLRRLGCRVVVAQSGAEALALLAQPVGQTPVDVVLMDRRMPGMDGLETTLAIREIPHRADVCIIGLSASVAAGERADCKAATMNGFVAKPASIADLRVAIVAGLDNVDFVDVEPPARPRPEGVQDRETPVDTDRLQRLVDEFEDLEMVRSLVSVFLDDLASQRVEIDRAHADGDTVTVSRIAHTVKGSSAMLGAEPLRNSASGVEQHPVVALDEFHVAADAASAALNEWLNTTGDQVSPST